MIRFHEALTGLLVPIGDVSQWPDNPNNGDIDAIATSMEINGVYQALVVQRTTGYILAGNHRYAAMVSLGATQVPVVYLDVDDDKARRIALADNRTGQLAWMDNALLLELLDDMADTDLGLLGTAYDDDFAERLHAVFDDPMVSDDDEENEVGAKQKHHQITCPNCGHRFGG